MFFASPNRLVQRRDVDDAFLAAVCKRRISLAYLFLGEGTPFYWKGGGVMAENDLVTRLIEKYERLDEKQQHIFGVLLHLMVNDPEVGKLDAEGLFALHKRLSQKPGEADAA
jgi:hypothetical protein